MSHTDENLRRPARQRARRARLAVAVLAAILLTIAGCLAVLNFTLGQRLADVTFAARHPIDDPQFLRLSATILGSPWRPGNEVRALVDGDEIFPAMLEAIHAAGASIDLETYIFWSGETARQFSDALSERARHGVDVNLLLDWFGGDLDHALLERMRAAGVTIAWYNAPRWYDLDRVNNRSHRRILVVDGRVGFTGGVGIADKWRGHAQDPRHWRDSHFRVHGPVVAALQGTFADHWLEATGEVLHGDAFVPGLEPQGPMRAQVFASSPGGAAANAQLMYLLAIGSAARSIRISAAYFIPDDPAIEALVAARRRGVQVQVIVPGPHIDYRFVERASRARWGPLLEAGVEISQYQPTMYHVKMVDVDDLWVSVGSTNFDPRSFAINEEANLNVYDADFGRTASAQFDADLARSRPVTLEGWRSRPLLERALDYACALLAPQL